MWAIGTRARTYLCAEIHQALRVGGQIVFRQQSFGNGPHMLFNGGLCWIAFNAVMAGENSFDVAVKNCGVAMKSKNGDCGGRRTANAGQFGKLLLCFGKGAVVIVNNTTRRMM